MPSKTVRRMLARSSRRIPGLKNLPMMRLLALAEVAVLARDHLQQLDPSERHRLVELVRDARGRPSQMTRRERDEFSRLVAKAQPREFAAEAAQKLSPVPIPNAAVRRAGRKR